MNPVDEFLALKHGTPKTAGVNLGNFGGALRDSAATGLGVGLAGAGVAMVGVAAQKIWAAATKAHDFKQMMGSSFNADLHEHHAMKPKEFNEAYSSLRIFNPAFAKDPMVAGTYMRRMMTFKPEDAGGTLIEALQHRKNLPDSSVGEAFQHGTMSGAQSGFMEHGKEQAEKTKVHQGAQAEKEKLRQGEDSKMRGFAQQAYFKRMDKEPMGTEDRPVMDEHGAPQMDEHGAPKVEKHWMQPVPTDWFKDIGSGKTKPF